MKLAWSSAGPSPSANPTDLYGGLVAASRAGQTWLVGQHFAPLQLRHVTADGWTEPVSEEDAYAVLEAAGIREHAYVDRAAFDGDGVLHAFLRTGEVFAYRDGWEMVVGPPSASSFGQRGYFEVAWDGGRGEFVVWGGFAGKAGTSGIGKRPSNDTLYLRDGAWVKETRRSPRPVDFDDRRPAGVTPRIAWDPVPGAVVRLGYADVAILVDGRWASFTPSGYAACRDGDAPWPVVDASRGEVLLVDVHSDARVVSRFDLQSTEVLGEAPAPDIAPAHMSVAADGPVLHGIDDSGCLRLLDLAEAAAQAASGSPRHTHRVGDPDAPLPEVDSSAPSSVHLYRLDGGAYDYWWGDVVDESVEVRAGSSWKELAKGKVTNRTRYDDVQAALAGLSALSEAQRSEGFRPLDDWDDDALFKSFTSRVDALAPSDCEDFEYGAYQWDYLGGLPRGFKAADWPSPSGGPFQHLACLSFFGTNCRGVSVFVNDAGETGVVLYAKEAQLKRKPKAGPEGTVEAEAVLLEEGGAQSRELGVHAGPFMAADPDLKARLQSLGISADPVSKNEGEPAGIDPELIPTTADGDPWDFVAQLALGESMFDGLRETWPDLPLSGMIYLFARPDGPEVKVVWQGREPSR